MKFDLATFRFLADLELKNGWNNIGVGKLNSYVDYLKTEGFTEDDIPSVFKAVYQTELFLNAIKSDLIGEDEPEQVVSAYAEQGVIDRVNGPCFWQGDDDRIVLRVGTTLYNAELKSEKLTVGKLKGGIEVSELTGADNKVVTDDEGNPVLRVTAKLRIVGEKASEVFYLPLMLSKDSKVSEGELLAAIEDGDIYQYLAPIPKGGGNFFDLRMLPVGDYLVTDISDKKVNEWEGKPIVSWNLTIAELGTVSSRGKNLEGQLETSGPILQRVARNRGVTLRVSKHDVEYTPINTGKVQTVPFPNFLVDLKNRNVKNLPEGKIGNSDVKHYMNVGILKDYQTEPNPPMLEMVNYAKGLTAVVDQAALPAATVVAEPVAEPVAELKSAAVVEEEAADLDSIPF